MNFEFIDLIFVKFWWNFTVFLLAQAFEGRSEKTEIARPEKETTKKEKGRERAGVRILRGFKKMFSSI